MLRHSFALALLAATLGGCASSTPRPQDTAIAAVQAVYVEVAPDIYVSEKLLASAPTRDYWVKIAMTGTAGDTSMARVPASLRLVAGDQVAVEVAPPPTRDPLSPSRRANRVLDILSHGALAQAPTRPRADLIDRYLSEVATTVP